MDLVTLKVLETIIGIVLKRKIGKASDSVFLFLSDDEDNTSERLNNIEERLNNIEIVLERIENKINAQMLRPLKSGWKHLKNAQKLKKSSLREITHNLAYQDFINIITLPYSNSVGQIDIDKVRSLSHFGLACVLNAMNESEDLISENIALGFLLSPDIAKSFITENIWNQMFTKCHRCKVLVTFNLTTYVERGDFIEENEHFIEIKLLKQASGEVITRKLKASGDSEKVKTFSVDYGIYDVKISATVEAVFGSFENHFGERTINFQDRSTWESADLKMATHTYFNISSKMKLKKGFWNAERYYEISVFETTQKKLNENSSEYKKYIMNDL